MMTTFRLTLAGWLLRLGEWIMPDLPPVPLTLLQRRVGELVAAAEDLDAGGAYKKWQLVAARLQKEFPAERHRDLNLLIEVAVQARAQSRRSA